MGEAGARLIIADEQNAERRYTEALRDRARRGQPYQGPRNTMFTGTGVPKLQAASDGTLVGRVALGGPNEMVGGAEFYIGERHAEIDNIPVFSWAAPVACTFFRGSDHHELCPQVVVLRAFLHHGGRIVDVADEAVVDDPPAQPFTRRGLAVPKAPDGRRLPLPHRTPSEDPSKLPPSDAPPTRVTPTTVPNPTEEALPSTTRPRRSTDPFGAVRAESLLRSQLKAPRERSLAPVLATLQPDQYSLVTLPAMESHVFEGQPGTGKTIIATHRAAYLVDDETPPWNSLDGDVLLVGPTAEYSAHVQPVVRRLTGDSDRVKVISLPDLMSQIIGSREEPRGKTSRTWQDVDTQLWKLAWRARSMLVGRPGSASPTVAGVYEHLRENGSAVRKLATDTEWSSYLRALPPFSDALTRRAHTPLLALISWFVAPPKALSNVEHIIVDEAQDVAPLEWQLLSAMNAASAWTLVGDLHQRRSDHTFSSWKQVMDAIEHSNGDDDLPVHHLALGYRSTKPILDFANQLLPRAERGLTAFQQEGLPPAISKVKSSDLATAAVLEAGRLLDAYPQGTVAVIGVDPTSIRQKLRSTGWQAERGNQRIWQRDGRHVVVVHPDAARGVEFDGVVVVEPSAFPQNYGRRGPLYTALTRPNRELAVVHAAPLPDELRDRGRR